MANANFYESWEFPRWSNIAMIQETNLELKHQTGWTGTGEKLPATQQMYK